MRIYFANLLGPINCCLLAIKNLLAINRGWIMPLVNHQHYEMKKIHDKRQRKNVASDCKWTSGRADWVFDGFHLIIIDTELSHTHASLFPSKDSFSNFSCPSSPKKNSLLICDIECWYW